MRPLEEIVGSDVPFRASCGICSGEYRPRLSNIRKGSSLTCGCASNHTSRASAEIADFVRSLGVESITEHPVSGWKYDVFIPSVNLVIEYNGLRWHSLPGSKERDLKKYLSAVGSGLSYMMIYEDEWKGSRAKVESLIRNRILRISPVSVRPSSCEVRKIGQDESGPFYDSYHYLGRCLAKAHCGVFLGKDLLACASFSVPSRQSPHPWELVRMASSPDYRVHGIWSKILRLFSNEYHPSSIVSFSENRLFSGSVYGKIGFQFDGDVRPDYCWCRSGRRFHKSGLRKPAGESRTETQLRESEGYRKIWDLGKKRWVYRPSSSA